MSITYVPGPLSVYSIAASSSWNDIDHDARAQHAGGTAHYKGQRAPRNGPERHLLATGADGGGRGCGNRRDSSRSLQAGRSNSPASRSSGPASSLGSGLGSQGSTSPAFYMYLPPVLKFAFVALAFNLILIGLTKMPRMKTLLVWISIISSPCSWTGRRSMNC